MVLRQWDGLYCGVDSSDDDSMGGLVGLARGEDVCLR